MTTYIWSYNGTDWGDPNSWTGGVPGPGDEALLNGAPTITTDGETVGSVLGADNPNTVLQGTGLTVTGEMLSVILDGGDYQAGSFFGTLEDGQLSGGPLTASSAVGKSRNPTASTAR